MGAEQGLVLEAEALGYDSVLIAQHTAKPYDDEWDELEAWTAAAGLAALTSRIEIIAAIKPPLVHPVILAKMAQQIEHISGGRFGLNLVNTWNRAEYEKAGIPFAEHDERYAYGREWMSVVEPLLRGERVTRKGRYFDVAGFQLRPADPFRARPAIYVGGESAPAQDLVAEYGDVFTAPGLNCLCCSFSHSRRRCGGLPGRFFRGLGREEGVDGRVKPGHDVGVSLLPLCSGGCRWRRGGPGWR